MGLRRATIAKAVGSAFKALGDIPESTVIRRVSNTYDTATGVNTKTTSDDSITKAVFTRYESFEVDKVVILATDVKLIFQQSEVSTRPDMALDTIIRGTSVYNILRVGEDPAAATYSLQLRSV